MSGDDYEDIDDDRDTEGLVSGVPNTYPPRTKNFPPCYPLFYHNLDEMPTRQLKRMMQKVLLGWFVAIFVYVINLCALGYSLFSGGSGADTISFIMAIVYVIGGPVVSFGIYMILYTAARKNNAMYYCCFLVWFAALTILFVVLAFGPHGFGGSGLLQIITRANDLTATPTHKGISPAVLVTLGVGMLLWLCVVGYHCYIMWMVRKQWNEAGGMKATTKEGIKASAQVAHDNKDTIKQVARDNKDTIKKVVVENQDVIRDAVVDNKDVLIDVARDNSDLVVDVVRDNPDIVVAAVSGGGGGGGKKKKKKDVNWGDMS